MRNARRFYGCVVVAVVVVTGAVSLGFSVGGFGDVGCRVMFFPSTPLLGSGAAAGMP